VHSLRHIIKLKQSICFAALEVKNASIFTNDTSITLSVDLSAMPCNSTTTSLVAKLLYYDLVTEEGCKEVAKNLNQKHVYKQKIIRLHGNSTVESKQNITFHQIINGCYSFELFPSTNGYPTSAAIYSKSSLSKDDLKHNLSRVDDDSGRSVRYAYY
jgi:hypothetical protein